MRLGVIGCGYLGTTHAACLAELGHDVTAVDLDAERVKRLASGDIPFFEPGLADLLRRQLATDRLHFTSDLSELAEFADVHFLCVGTPQQTGGLGADMSYVDAAVTSLAALLARPTLLVGKSTVPVGTGQRLVELVKRCAPDVVVDVAWNPEFLREGHAIEDTLRPDRLVFGVSTTSAETTLRKIYAPVLNIGTPLVVTDLATAELVKASANAFLATKISFINAIAEVCDAAGADVTQLARALGYDSRIGPRSLGAGLGYGGGCLPKDIRALIHRAGELGTTNAGRLLREVDAINEGQRRHVVARAVSMSSDLPRARVAVLGAAFKPGSDDVRDSPALYVASSLQSAGCDVVVYDPEAMRNARLLHPTLRYAASAKDACVAADLLLHLTEWPEFGALSPVELGDVVAHRRILDARNCLDPKSWRAASWMFQGVGRP